MLWNLLWKNCGAFAAAQYSRALQPDEQNMTNALFVGASLLANGAAAGLGFASKLAPTVGRAR